MHGELSGIWVCRSPLRAFGRTTCAQKRYLGILLPYRPPREFNKTAEMHSLANDPNFVVEFAIGESQLLFAVINL